MQPGNQTDQMMSGIGGQPNWKVPDLRRQRLATTARDCGVRFTASSPVAVRNLIVSLLVAEAVCASHDERVQG
ncbi:hypothetical protein DPMN_059139 [Dreissena polymorpha]|uniref:Uncharacterized protein n=1 Tax=Dreissena polymorpha TaxID=45954 RepID=A0A9D4C3E9_DREPO|nr:hypothetical protein DPMN_059139 [Dreissena polymorpha]